MNDTQIPFGWEKLKPTVIQEATDWWWNGKSWKKNSPVAIGRTQYEFEQCFDNYGIVTIRRYNNMVNSDPNVVTQVVDNPNDVSKENTDIPFGWRQLKSIETRRDGDYWWSNFDKQWYMSGEASLASFGTQVGNLWVHIRKINDTDNSVETLVAQLSKAQQTIDTLNASLIDEQCKNSKLQRDVETLTSGNKNLVAEITTLKQNYQAIKNHRDGAKIAKIELINLGYALLNVATLNLQVGDLITVKRNTHCNDWSYVGDKLRVKSVAYPNITVDRIDKYDSDIDKNIKLNLTEWEILPWGQENSEDLKRKAQQRFQASGY